MKIMKIIEKVELIRCLQALLESNYFSAGEKKVFKEKLLELTANL